MSTKKSARRRLVQDIEPHDAAWTVTDYLELGYYDYVAARVLLINNLHIQGLTLASTCIEKYLKAVLAVHNKTCKTHLDEPEFLEVFDQQGIDISYISKSFLDYLGRSYKFRYIEPTSPPASAVVEPLKLLAELDYSVSVFEGSFSDRLVESPYRLAVQSNDERVWQKNYVLNKIDKTEFVSTPCDMYATIIAPMTEIAKLTAHKFKSKNNSIFDFPRAKIVLPNRLEIEFASSEECIYSTSSMDR
jgi:hypothetical protein